MKFDIVITNGTVVTCNKDFEIFENGIICIKDGDLVKIEDGSGLQSIPEADKIIDAKGSIVMPGLVNTHTHLPMTLFRGLADDLPLQEWLEEHIFPAEAKHINKESVKIGTRLACAEMIMSGTTACCDGYFLEKDVAEAVFASGIRAVLGQGVIDFPAPGVPDPSENINHAEAYASTLLNTSPLITPSIFCHSPYTCSPETLKKAKAAADSNQLVFQIHVAETKHEYENFQSEHHLTPVQYLDSLGILDKNTLLVHCVWVDDKDIEIMLKQGVNVSHNPESNMKLASGIAPVSKMLSAGIPVGLGTDGCASNNTLDLFRTMDITAKLHKVDMSDPTVMSAIQVLKIATIGGAKVIGLDMVTGSLEAGKKADLIIIKTDQPHMVPMYHPASHLVYTAQGSDVYTSMINGRIVLEDGKLLCMDLEEILEDSRAIGKVIANGK